MVAYSLGNRFYVGDTRYFDLEICTTAWLLDVSSAVTVLHFIIITKQFS